MKYYTRAKYQIIPAYVYRFLLNSIDIITIIESGNIVNEIAKCNAYSNTFVSLCKYTRDTSFLLFISFLEKTAFVLPEPPNRIFHFDDAPVNTSSDKSEIGSPTKSSGT